MSTVSRPQGARTGRLSGLHMGLLMLAFSSGAMDAFAFLSLGGIFTGMMTGNLILIGLFTRPEFVHVLIGAGTAIALFIVGAFVGFRALRERADKPVAPASIVTRALIPSLIAQAVAAVVWLVSPPPAALGEQVVMVALLALSLSLQTVAAKKASDVMGVTTTYVTGTLTTTMQELVESQGRGNLLRVATVLALPLGAVCATAVVVLASPIALLLPLLVSAGATALVHGAITHGSPRPTAH